MVSITDADWSREVPRKFWDPSRKLLLSIRCYQKCKQKKGFIALVISKICVIQHAFWSAISGADIPISCNIGGGLLIPHPNGIVIHPQSEIGINCLIHQQVTVGVKRGNAIPPKISAHVDIGAGAKIIGNINIGDHSLIGANAVVVKDVEAGVIVAGIPARAIGFTQDKYNNHD
ncbi:serine acetyltransferase [Methyloprofundus sedimenti]|uniref:Serine acetyltransferase n=1 Tax=Methyloprofundus sedimenti TaxID=1420851 RepID=A0A1V8M661_9GAMM|nr:serine acetyltransferase [Methyloprofundus sedimenti]OQK17037.1 serine acetyltransferase [Methyloprofundus sedimenti]